MKIRDVLIVLFAMTGCLAAPLSAAESTQKLNSPGGKITVDVHVGARIRYDVMVNDVTVLKNSSLSLKIDNVVLGISPKLKLATVNKLLQF